MNHKITRQEFMDFFRDTDTFNFEMTEDDKREIFLNVLSGSSDLTCNLLRELCDNYDIELVNVLNREK